MSIYFMCRGFGNFTCWVRCYNLYSALNFASGRVANRRNRPAITPHRALPATKFNVLYSPFNGGLWGDMSGDGYSLQQSHQPLRISAGLRGLQTMADHMRQHRLQIFRQHVIAPGHQRPGACAV